jgi:ribosome maturation factor RimP
VSTPGLDRKFFYSYQLNDFVGKTLKIKLKDKINDKKIFKAILKSVDNDYLQLHTGKEELKVDFGIIDMCKLIPNYKEILREKNGR